MDGYEIIARSIAAFIIGGVAGWIVGGIHNRINKRKVSKP